MKNPNSYRKWVDGEKRNVDAIVVHHISAIFWNDERFQQTHRAKIDAFVASLDQTIDFSSPNDYKFDWRFCKQILELYGFSAHYLIDRDGVIRQLVRDNDVAFHAGGSVMPNSEKTDVNDFSIGIELIASHPTDDRTVTRENAYTQEQYESLNTLLKSLMFKHEVKLNNIIGHEDIAGKRAVDLGLRTSAKKDPGPFFDWAGVKERLDADINNLHSPSYKSLGTGME